MDDLRAAKPTVLLALTFARADAAQGRRLRALVGDPDLDDAAAMEIAGIIRASGALAATEALIDERAMAAGTALAGLAVSAEVRSELAGLADRALARTR